MIKIRNGGDCQGESIKKKTAKKRNLMLGNNHRQYSKRKTLQED